MNKIKGAFDEIKASDELKEKTISFIKEAAKAETASEETKENITVKKQSKKKKFFAPILTFAMACIACFFVFNIYFTAYSYVGVDINPSIELKVNRFGKVIGSHSYNEDGRKVLDSLNIKYKDYEQAMDLIYDEVANQGYLKDDSYIALSLQTDNNKSNINIEKTLNKCTRKNIDKHHLKKAEYEIVKVSGKERTEALNAGVSACKYKAIEELQKYDDTATVDKYKHHSMREIKNKTKECRSEHNRQQKHNNKTNNTTNKQTKKQNKQKNKQKNHKQNQKGHH